MHLPSLLVFAMSASVYAGLRRFVSKQINSVSFLLAASLFRIDSLRPSPSVAISITLVPLWAFPFLRFAMQSVFRLALQMHFGSCVALRIFSIAAQTDHHVAYPLLIPACPLDTHPCRSFDARLQAHLCHRFTYPLPANPRLYRFARVNARPFRCTSRQI